MGESRLITRRQMLLTGAAALGGLALPGCADDGPPTYGHILRMGDNFTYRAHRLLFSRTSLAREFDRRDITSIPAVGTSNPADPDRSWFDEEGGAAYARLLSEGFDTYRLEVTGSVDRPQTFSLADLQSMARRTQVTRHMCEEGWSAIAEWTGVPLRAVLVACGLRPSARWVEFHPFDAYPDSIDLVDAFHPQTILAYGMNGRELPIVHGAPLRVRVERQIGYKSVKFVRRIVVSDRFDDFGKNGNIQNGWAWYNGI